MVLISLVFLFVYLFGAYAYGAATFFSLPPGQPLWGLATGGLRAGRPAAIDKAEHGAAS